MADDLKNKTQDEVIETIKRLVELDRMRPDYVPPDWVWTEVTGTVWIKKNG